jgi:hypothetical protein
MTVEEKLAAYIEMVRRIVIHADSFGDVHYTISQILQKHPELKEDAPWFN